MFKIMLKFGVSASSPVNYYTSFDFYKGFSISDNMNFYLKRSSLRRALQPLTSSVQSFNPNIEALLALVR